MTDPQSPQLRLTPLAAVHERLGAKMTGFAGWLMPLRYQSETAEHQAVRTAAGLFDLSHMGEIMIAGPAAAAALDYALVGQPSALAPGRARYTMICAPDGGIIDDLIVYRLAADEFLVVANAANTPAVFAELAERHGLERGRDRPDRRLRADRPPRAWCSAYPQAHQRGPQRGAVLRQLPRPSPATTSCWPAPATPARTASSFLTRPGDAEPVWTALSTAGAAAGLVPAGLAARDTLRLEAAMPLYGNELSRDVTPFDAGLGRVVKLDKTADFVGRDALARRAQATPERVLVGLIGQPAGSPGTAIWCCTTAARAAR